MRQRAEAARGQPSISRLEIWVPLQRFDPHFPITLAGGCVRSPSSRLSGRCVDKAFCDRFCLVCRVGIAAHLHGNDGAFLEQCKLLCKRRKSRSKMSGGPASHRANASAATDIDGCIFKARPYAWLFSRGANAYYPYGPQCRLSGQHVFSKLFQRRRTACSERPCTVAAVFGWLASAFFGSFTAPRSATSDQISASRIAGLVRD